MAKQPELFSTDVPPWELDLQGECRVAKVVFAEPPHGPLDYLVPDALAAEVQLVFVSKCAGSWQPRKCSVTSQPSKFVRQSPDAFKPIQTVLDPSPGSRPSC